jgi:hypothetical protein
VPVSKRGSFAAHGVRALPAARLTGVWNAIASLGQTGSPAIRYKQKQLLQLLEQKWLRKDDHDDNAEDEDEDEDEEDEDEEDEGDKDEDEDEDGADEDEDEDGDEDAGDDDNDDDDDDDGGGAPPAVLTY